MSSSNCEHLALRIFPWASERLNKTAFSLKVKRCYEKRKVPVRAGCQGGSHGRAISCEEQPEFTAAASASEVLKSMHSVQDGVLHLPLARVRGEVECTMRTADRTSPSSLFPGCAASESIMDPRLGLSNHVLECPGSSHQIHRARVRYLN
jgi:hypothetical protein